MSEIAERVKNIIVDKLGVEASEVTTEASFTNDQGADSLDTVELIMEFEKEFGISIPDDQAEKIAPAKTRISYTDDSGVVHNMRESGNTSLILTYNRATGGFRQIQTETIGQEKILDQLDQGKDVAFHDSGSYCQSMTILGGGSQKSIQLNKDAGTYKVVDEQPDN